MNNAVNDWLHNAWLAYLSGCHVAQWLGVKCWWGY